MHHSPDVEFDGRTDIQGRAWGSTGRTYQILRTTSEHLVIYVEGLLFWGRKIVDLATVCSVVSRKHYGRRCCCHCRCLLKSGWFSWAHGPAPVQSRGIEKRNDVHTMLLH